MRPYLWRQHYYDFNLDKHRANISSVSIEDPLDGDGKSTVGDTIIDEGAERDSEIFEADAFAKSLIQTRINRKKLVEAIVLDVIAHNDCFRTTRETVKTTDAEGNVQKQTVTYKEFWKFRCVQILSKLPSGYADYFSSTYNVNAFEFSKALEAVRAANNQKLYRYLSSALADAKATLTA